MPASLHFANPPQGTISDLIDWFFQCHAEACRVLSRQSRYHSAEIEAALGRGDNDEIADILGLYNKNSIPKPYLSLIHSSSWGFEACEQVELEIFLPDGLYHANWWYGDAPDADWQDFLLATGLSPHLATRPNSFEISTAAYDG